MAKQFFSVQTVRWKLQLKRLLKKTVFFITALGTAFDFTEFEFMEDLNQLINKEDIKEILYC